MEDERRRSKILLFQEVDININSYIKNLNTTAKGTEIVN